MQLILSVGLKGGVGKTTVSVGLAHALESQGYKVGILDLDYRTPNVPLAFNQPSELDHSYEGDSLIPARIDNIQVMSMAYIWPTFKCVLVEDTEAMEDVIHLLKPGIIAWDKDLDYLVVDTPPTSTGVVEIALGNEDVKGAIVVTHSSTFSRMDMIRTLDLFAEKEVPIIGVVCNQSIDENGEPRYDLEPSDIKDVCDSYGLELLTSIPHSRDKQVLEHYFTCVANEIDREPVILKVKLPGDEAWNALQSLTKKL